MTGRDLCRASLDWLIDAGVLKPFDETGRFVAPLDGAKGSLNAGQRLLAHYTPLTGPLYRDDGQWKRAQQLVAMFEAQVASARGRRLWRVPAPFGAIGGVSPAEFLTHVQSAMSAAGFSISSRTDAAGSLSFVCQDTCLVLDLPEPYGKWFQHREGRSRWEAPFSLAVEVRCQTTRRTGPGDEYLTILDFESSAVVPFLIVSIHLHLGRVPALQHLAGAKGKRAVASVLAASAQTFLDSAMEPNQR